MPVLIRKQHGWRPTSSEFRAPAGMITAGSFDFALTFETAVKQQGSPVPAANLNLKPGPVTLTQTGAFTCTLCTVPLPVPGARH